MYEGKWLGIKEIVYSIGDTVLSPYESAYRTTSAAKKLFVDGVEIVPIISSKHHGQKLVLITNFRPPIGKFCL